MAIHDHQRQLLGDLRPLRAANPSTGNRTLARWRLPTLVFAVGALATLAGFLTVQSRERSRRRAEFDRRAVQIALSIQAGFEVPLEVLRSIPAYFEASVEITRAEFGVFVRPALERYPWIYALEWIPRVRGPDRAAYEAAAERDGIQGFHFKQDAPDGPPTPSRPRDEYFPLYYMEPLNPIPLGLEETALETRRVALELARDTGATAITERLKLVQDDPSIGSIIAFHPVFAAGSRPTTAAMRRQSLRGLAAMVFRLEPVAKGALNGVALDDLLVALIDLDSKTETPLYESVSGAHRRLQHHSADTWERVVRVAGRNWAIRVGQTQTGTPVGPSAWLALIAGLVTNLLVAALSRTAQTILRLRRQVHEASRLGQYTLIEKLGEGGMGTVYRAHHALLRRPTAIKLIQPERCSPAAIARFEAEVQITSQLMHPNTVVVYDYGHSPEGVFYYAMEYIDGTTLEDLVAATGPQAPERVIYILNQICAALGEAHAIELVHRDIKPANIMLCQRGTLADFVKVLDFGLVKDLCNPCDTKLSQSTALLGTPLYIAPEMILNKPYDSRLDIYSLGAVAYFLLTAEPVFEGRTVLDLCAQHLAAKVVPPSARLGRPLPDRLDRLVLACLEKEPHQRPASVEQIARSLNEIDCPEWTLASARAWWQEHREQIDTYHQASRARGVSSAQHGSLSFMAREI